MKLLQSVIFIFIIFAGCFASAGQNLYEVENFPVSATAANAKKAREIALEHGQIEAFRKLTHGANFSPAQIAKNKENILNAAREFQIIDESMAKYSYRATINVYFSKSHVDQILASENIDINSLTNIKNYLKTTSKQNTQPQNQEEIEKFHKKLIIPIISMDGVVMLWSEQNLWHKIWLDRSSLAEENGLVVPVGDLDDIALTNYNMLLASYNNVKPLLEKYGADKAMIALAEVKRDRSGYRVSLSIKNLTPNHDHSFLKKYIDYQGKDSDTLLTESLYKVINLREDRLYDIKNLEVQISDNTELDANTKIETLKDWIELAKALDRVNQVLKFTLVEFNSNNLIINIISKVKVAELKTALGRKGYELLEINGNFVIKIRE